MDRKFGRLFTEEDVEEMCQNAVTAASGMGVGEGDVTRLREALNGAKGDQLAGGRFPEDEPLFLLRGQDLLAPSAVDAYGQELFGRGDTAMAQAVQEVTQGMREWQRANPSRVKLPD